MKPTKAHFKWKLFKKWKISVQLVVECPLRGLKLKGRQTNNNDLLFFPAIIWGWRLPLHGDLGGRPHSLLVFTYSAWAHLSHCYFPTKGKMFTEYPVKKDQNTLTDATRKFPYCKWKCEALYASPYQMPHNHISTYDAQCLVFDAITVIEIILVKWWLEKNYLDSFS